MESDPTGSASESPVSSTTADPTPALTTEPTVAGSSAVEGQTDGTEDESTPTPDSPESAEDDGDTEGDESEQTDEQKKLSRRDRQREREQARITAAIEADRVQRAREAETAAETAKRTAAAEKAAREKADRLSAFIGVPDAPGKPGTIGALEAENAGLYERLRLEIGTLSQDDFDEINSKIESNKARAARITENQSMSSEIEGFVWSQIEQDFVFPTTFPELADPAVKAKYLRAEGGIPGALTVLREAVRSAAIAEKDAEITALIAKHTSEMKAQEAETNSWRIRAGGAEVADTTSGGNAALNPGEMTLGQFRSLPFEKRKELRLKNPSLVDDIYRRSA